MVYSLQFAINCKLFSIHKVYGKKSICERVL